MKNKKRWLAGLLAVILIMNTFVGSALAKNEDGSSAEVQTEEVAKGKEVVTTTEEKAKESTTEATTQEKSTEKQEQTTEAKKEDATTEEKKATTEKKKETKVQSAVKKVQTDTVLGNDATQSKNLHSDTSFNSMCTDIFGVDASQFVTENNENYRAADYREIYIAGERAEEISASLGSSKKPYTSLDEAYRVEKGNGTKGVIIHLMDSYSLENNTYSGYKETIDSWSQYALKSVIVSDSYENSYLEMGSLEWSFPENTGFYNVQVNLAYETNKTSCIFANGYTMVFGGYGKNNFTFMNENTSRNYPVLFGASAKNSGTKAEHSVVKQTMLKVYGGTWRQIFGGGQFFSDVTNTAKTTIDGYIKEKGTDNYGGAVQFQEENDQTRPFGYYQIYGGGAALGTSTNEEEYSHIGNTSISVSHITINKSLTPCGGFISEKSEINMEWCKVANYTYINARAEGNVPNKVSLNLDHCTQGIGSMIGSIFVLNVKNVVWGRINDFDINIQNSTVSLINLKYSGQSGNAIDNVDVVVKDSEFQQLRMGALWAEQYGGRINSITLDHATAKSTPAVTGSNVDFKELGTITLKNMGTADKPFEMQDGTWGNVQQERYKPEKVVLENSYVKFDYGYQIGELKTTNSSVEIAKDIEVNVNKKYENEGANNNLILNANSVLKLNGDVVGTNSKISANLEEQGQTGNVLWKNGDSTDYFDFSDDLNSNYATEKKIIQSMTYWNVRYGKSTKQYVYLDGEKGKDTIAGYDNKCAEAQLGYDNAYPVKTLKKAYELVKNQDTKIILCGNYVFDFEGKESLDFLSKDTDNKDYQVTLSSKTDSIDYQISSAIIFRGATQKSFLNLNGSFRFENIILENKEAQYKFVLCNGYDTYFDESVTIKDCSTTVHYMGILGGSKDTGVPTTHLEVYNSDWSLIGASGYGKDSYVGSGNENNISKEQIAYLKANLKYARNGNYQYGNNLSSKVIYQGTTYGSVDTELNLEEEFCNIYVQTSGEPDSKAGTVFGDFVTTVTSSTKRDYVNAKICPEGITVKGKTVYRDTSDGMGYDYMRVPDATLNEVEVTCNLAKGSGAGYVQLFGSKTVFQSIKWNLQGNKKVTMYAADTNESISSQQAKVTVHVSDRDGTYKAASQNTSDYNKGFLDNKNIKLILDNFKNRTIGTIIGFGSVEFSGDGSNIVNTEIHTNELSVKNKASVTAYAPIKIGTNEKPTGKLLIQGGAKLKLQNSFNLYGDMEGETDENSKIGTLTNNYADSDDQAEKIVISGTTLGKTYYTTDYEKAEIQVNGKTSGSEYDVPKNEDGTSNYSITCNPASGKEEVNRNWTIVNSVSRKYVYVNGSLDATTAEYEKHDGSTPTLAYATIKEAYDSVLKNGSIIICGDTEINEWPSNATKKVTVTSKVTLPNGQTYNFFDGDGQQQVDLKIAGEILLRSDTTFEYLNLYNTIKGNAIIAGNGYKLVMGHEGDGDSLNVDTNNETYGISIAGGSCFNNKVIEGNEINVQVYAGTYKNIVAGNYINGSVHTYSYFHPTKILFNVKQAKADYIKFADDYYTFFDKVTSCSAIFEDTKINKGFSVFAGHGDDVGTLSMRFGKNVVFDQNAVCVLGKTNQHSATQGTNTQTISVSIDGTDGEYYEIPVVVCGMYTNEATKADEMSVSVTLKNAGIRNFYGAGSVKSECGMGTTTVLKMQENAKIENIHCGGNYYAGKSMKLILEDSTAQVKSLDAACLYSSEKPQVCEITYNGIGTVQKPYTLKADADFDGFSNVIIKDSYVTLDNSKNRCEASKISTEGKSGIFLSTRGYIIDGNYIASTDAADPGYLYCSNAATVRIEGTVSGYTKVLAKKTLNQETDAGKFNNGFSIFAKKAENNEAGQFVDFEDKELDFSKGNEYDQWVINDSEDNKDRVNVYVADYGNDIAEGNYAQPVKTLKVAFEKSQKIYDSIKTDSSLTDTEKTEKIANLSIILLTDIEVLQSDSEINDLTADHVVTITSEDNDAKNIILSKQVISLGFNTNVKLDYVILKNTCSTKSGEVYANGYKLEVSEHMKTEASTNYYPILYGGSKERSVDSTSMKVYGGQWSAIYGGGQQEEAVVTGDVSLLTGRQIDMYAIGNYSETSTGLFGGGQFAQVNGAVHVNIDGGKYYRIHGGGKNRSAETGNITVKFNSGITNMLYGGGEQAASGSIKVDIGVNKSDVSDVAEITSRFRGSALYGTLKQKAETTVNVYSNAKINDGVEFAAGGYSGELYKANLNIFGGKLNCNIFTGGWGEGIPGNKGTAENTEVTINDGTINGNIYGAGNLAIVSSKAILNINGGTIHGNIYGGGNAAGAKETQLIIDSNKQVTGNIFGGSYNITNENGNIQELADVQLERTNVDGAIFGGSDTSGLVKKTAKVEANGNVKVSKGIFGGGSKAALKITPEVTVNTDATVEGNIFGGGKGELKTENKFARTLLRIFTDSDLNDANVPSTDVRVNGVVNGDIFAGGEYATVGTTNEDATTNELSKEVAKVTINGTVTGKVYGGGKGEKNKNYAAINGSTNVTLATGGNVTADNHAENAQTGVIFGGGQNAPVAGNTNVNVNDGNYSTIFGGNDVSGEIQGTTNVTIKGAKTEHAYGAGRDAAYNGTGANVTINDKTSKTTDSEPTVSEVYGGGYGKGAETNKANVSIQNGKVTMSYAGGNAAPTKDTQISVTGGTTDEIFGGGNAATITGSSKVTVNTKDEDQHVNTVFAGNNKAAMAIKPTLNFENGTIDTVYCGGNQGIMTYQGDSNTGIEYKFDYPNAKINTVFAGCNNTTEQTSNVALTLTSGTYDTIYGGNNQNGNMAQTSVILDATNGKDLKVNTIYGGGNQADAVNTQVSLKNGTVNTVYGGGNAATATGTVKIQTPDDQANTDSVKVTDLYCGNNQAEMSIVPTINLKKATITNFYGGGNKGIMTAQNGLNYTFDSDDLMINTIYGGGNEAGVTKEVTLNVKKGNYTDIYGGSNSKGTVKTSNVNIQGNVGTADTNGKVFGGGKGNETIVNDTNVALQNGTIRGNVYGGSGFGNVGTAKVVAKESSGDTVKVLGNIYGAGYGVSSSADTTTVDVNLKLNIKENGSGDVKIQEILKSNEDKSGESKASATWMNSYENGSYISGNVFGGGDMGQIGKGYINVSTNTAVIEKGGTTAVNINSGYIHGNVFGGGNGQPSGKDESGNNITEYTPYMGTVFGTSKVTMTGGYVNGNMFGCGQQSRTYAATDTTGDNQKDASIVDIITNNTEPILIGGSIFGGGNKGNGTTQNASVATVYGDTHVKLQGVQNQYTQIYLLSNGTNGGGVYGDGNLCLVSGKKYVTLENFSCGVGQNVNLLKTFYSLQRADVVDIIASRIVLKGAVDLVAENADDTVYSINRAGQVNLKKSSTIKVTKTVNLLGELTSDEQTGRQFINRGNNDGNANISGNDYKGHGGDKPAQPLLQTEVDNYISTYDTYSNTGSLTNSTYKSINVVCVANGGYLEVKKNAKEYGPVTGLFTLQLVNANAGEGGGFVYADIMGKKIGNKYVTGNFVCVTKQSDNSDNYMYMYAYHNVGGQLSDDGKYEYYLWYLKGNKYSYDVDLTGYIGTKDTDFTKTVSLAAEPDYCFILTQLNQSKELNGIDLKKMYQNTWSDSNKDSEKFAVEVTLITKNRSESTIKSEEKSIGYIGYQTTDDTDPKATAKTTDDGKLIWGIWRADENNGWKFQACKESDNEYSFAVKDGDALAEIGSDVVSAQLKFTLHKGTGMTTEFRNLPFEMKIAEARQSDYNNAINNNRRIQEDSCIRLTTNLNLSAIRLVPTQAAYMGSGRMFAGVSSSSTVDITKTSAFTAQFVTKYIPSAFNTGSTNQIEETLTTNYSDTYLLDTNGVGYTIKEGESGITILNVVNNNDPDVKNYRITKDGDIYKVSYLDSNKDVLTDEDGSSRIYDCTVTKQNSGFTLPKGTMITLLASLDEQDPTYWYYYCTEDTTDVPLKDFKKMNTSNGSSTSKKLDTVYDTISTTSSSRVTENMIFVLDFSEVKSADWSNTNALNGKLQLKHTYTSSAYTSDIMDYVATESETSNGTTKTSYKREMPRQTDNFKISPDSDGITKFNISNADDNPTYGQKDKMRFRLEIDPDTKVTNTQYEEREYAVILKLHKKGEDTDIPFPEGTVFNFNGKQLIPGKDNKYVIVPVDTVGRHEVEITSKLKGFDENQYELIATLYSTSEEGYYNSIKVKGNTGSEDITNADFTIKEDPVYALKVTEKSAQENARKKNHFASVGESFKFEVTAKGGETDDQVGIQLYQLKNKAYKKITTDTILEGSETLKRGTGNWNPKVKEDASKGIYRLEFTYHDKTEYWDFMVR